MPAEVIAEVNAARDQILNGELVVEFNPGDVS